MVKDLDELEDPAELDGLSLEERGVSMCTSVQTGCDSHPDHARELR